MERMRAPAVPLNPPPVLSDEESARLLAACRGTDLIARRDLAMLSLLLDTGIRRGELAGGVGGFIARSRPRRRCRAGH